MAGHKIRGAFWVVLFSFLTFPHLLFAAPAGVPTTFAQLIGALCRLTNWIFSLLLILGVLSFLAAAFMFLSAGGSSEKVGTARKLFMYAMIGVAIAFLARALVFIIGNLVGATVNDLGC